jgi:hypothetical protein
MLLNGSCHCGAVHFSLHSATAYPYQRCYCSICRKTQGGGGFSINIGGDARTMKIKGRKNINIYHAKLKEPGDKRAHRSTAERAFCRCCGTALWLYSPEWPELIHPFASAIDTPLPVPPEHTHIRLQFQAPWVESAASAKDQEFAQYPEESIAEWHARLGY